VALEGGDGNRDEGDDQGGEHHWLVELEVPDRQHREEVGHQNPASLLEKINNFSMLLLTNLKSQ
jgi:hypothetical protein